MAFANLYIAIHLWEHDRYAINLSFTQSGSEVDTRAEVVGLPLSRFDRDRFLQVAHDPQAYGRFLGECLLVEPGVERIFAHALSSAQQLEVPLRVQLVLSPNIDLHDLCWETLRNPHDGTALFVRNDLLFSRYLSSEDTRPVRLRDRDELRALVAVAAPDDVESYGLPRVDVTAELTRAEKLFHKDDIDATILNATGPVSLRAIIDGLSDEEGGYDILYLICHGALVEGEPRLWLEKEDKREAVAGAGASTTRSAIVSGRQLAERLTGLTNRPRLVILMSCESAGRGASRGGKDDGALSAVGPRLALAGIPAVIAMQGSVSIETVNDFLPPFFKSLRKDGQIDKAMATARAAIQDENDAWMPVLFLRSNTGRLWARPGLQAADAKSQFSAWETLLNYIVNGECTPVIGFGVTDDLCGSQREIARRWAELYRYPLSAAQRNDLPQVAQFRAVTTAPANARIELLAQVHRELIERYGRKVPGLTQRSDLGELISEVGRWKRANEPEDLHQILAELRCPLYLTTNPDQLLVDALRELEGGPREVHERAFDWISANPACDRLFQEDSDYWPSREQPLVYHLFGSLTKNPKTKKVDLRNLVLSQDDYFQYLTAMVRNDKSLPTPVRDAMTNSALMFVGFHLCDWNFRVLLQSIREREGMAGNPYSHVAVQIDPEEGDFQDPEMARRYLQKIGKINNSDLSIYWGSTSSFLGELRKRLAERHPVGQSFELVSAGRSP
jgi:hypothetical protein